MKALLLLLLAFTTYTTSLAQSTATVTVKAGSSIMDVLSTAEVFHYPQFTSGKVFFRDGSNAEAKMNYNRLLDEMHFIGPTGDTLALANERLIHFIAVGDDSFYYEQTYLRRIAGNNIVRLAVNQVWKITDKKKASAYGITSSISSISSRGFMTDGRKLYNMNVKEDVVLSNVEHYYFGDKYGRFVLAGKKNLQILFPKVQEQLVSYLKDNKVDFTKKEDLENVVKFLEHL